VTTRARQQAALTLGRVLQQQRSLSGLLPDAIEKVELKDKALLQELCYGTLRWYPKLQFLLNQLLSKALKPKDSDIQGLLLIGIYQLLYMRIPDHAVISETVDVCRALKKQWATKLVNGVLRNMQRQQASLLAEFAGEAPVQYAHPKWLIKAIAEAWPEQAEDIYAANNNHPPFTLRLNTALTQREDYLKHLPENLSASANAFSETGLTLAQACDVFELPGFTEGKISVQDEAAQLAAPLLGAENGERILDACCAPGGKTGHILESATELKLQALDSDAKRLVRVQENLDRLQRQATLICGDALDLAQWWDGETYDRILVDAPCSGTGVIRRHPDIKLLRKPADIDKLAALQGSILDALWQTLKPGGRLVYATCSIMPKENTETVEAFLQRTSDAKEDVLNVAWGMPQVCGRQLLPQNNGHDGFYYAVLSKIAEDN